MELSQIEKQRSGLVQFLVVLIMIFLGLIMYISYRQRGGYAIPALTILSLGACLYVMARERQLKATHTTLVQEIIDRERQVDRLGEFLEAEHKQLEQERGRTTDLGFRLMELTGLYRAISSVNAAVDYQQTLDTALRAALELVGGDCGSIMLLDDPRRHLVISASSGLGDHIVDETRQPVGQGVAGWVLQHGEPVLLTGTLKTDERFDNLVERETEVHFAISVPLTSGERAMGVINLGSTSSEGKFTEYDLRLANIFAQHAAVAIENVQLRRTLKDHGLLAEPA